MARHRRCDRYTGYADPGTEDPRPVEFHLYEQGEHGFGMYAKTTTSTRWFDAFVHWLAMRGRSKPAG
ncbi:MAG TPA: hypothetical protein VIZ63_24580 [Povalibacter sp.]